MMLAYDPVVNGLRQGCLVRIAGIPTKAGDPDYNGKLGQLGEFDAAAMTFSVAFFDGTAVDFDVNHVVLANNLEKPGEGGAEDSFDLLLSSQTSPQVLGEEISMCLFEKGFCVLKSAQRADDSEKALEAAKELDESGKFFRFPEEVEEHYLGEGTTGKCFWLDPDDRKTFQDELVLGYDAGLTTIASLIQPYTEDTCGAQITERSPALLTIPFKNDVEEDDYPSPEATDKVLGTFLTTWRRQVLKIVQCVGPTSVALALVRKDDSPAVERLPKLKEDVEITCDRGMLVIFRCNCFDLECKSSGETLLLSAAFLKPCPEMIVESVEGDLELFRTIASGPPAPPGDELANVMAMGSRMAANWDEPEAAFTGLLCSTDAVVKIPLRRFDIDIYYHEDMNAMAPWQTYCRHMCVVEAAEYFDNKLFEISNMETQGMDPRQRMVMEVGAKVLAGIGVTKTTANRQVSNAGIAVGTDGHEWPSMPKGDLGACGNSSNALGITANRFSFTFNMRGPNFLIDTACSASLYAAHYIKTSLMERRWDPLEWCLAIGVQLYITVDGFIGCSQAHMLSPEGRCKTFNASADGYQRGDGTNGFVMKHGNLRDERFGLFRGSNVNQDGRSASLTAPNGPAQEQCIWGAIREARMTPPESSVWECHGTGTSLGDPIEVGAVRKVQIKFPRTEPLMLASIKANIGHLEGGAAMSAMVKCILQVSSTTCCPTGHFRSLNPHLEHSTFDAIYQTECANFHYACGHSQVSSFGFGGSNGHGIFWGEDICDIGDIKVLAMSKIKKRPYPEVRPVGRNPDNWDSDWPAADAKDGDKYTVTIDQDDTDETPIKWELKESAPENEQEEDDAIEFYEITGNFNEWTSDRMMAGSVTGVFVTTVEVPESGILEFRFLADGDDERVLGPAVPKCTRKTEKIIGPEKGLKNSWMVHGVAGMELEIQLLITKKWRSVMWLKPGD
mmetsp:Transcript_89637/g.208795  ORF Transcript_89637/g.208795 Transcript_89637/m.208795 type:complete len:956 (+) Transcript_89637:161-3028(+)